jgi:NAD+ synthase
VAVSTRQRVDSLDERAAREREYLQSSGRETFICSLSGGVDSATSAAIAARAAPGRTLALLLPCSTEEELRGERLKDIVDGQRAAEALGVPAVVINLSDLWRQAVALFEEHARRLAAQSGVALDEGRLQWAIHNLKPTLRMMTAGFFADAFAGLTMGTDNAIENFLGYFSVRGDGIADRQPIRDCTKAEVRALARSAGLPEDIVERTPTAGLWPGQTDEGELGFTYAQADAFFVWILERHLERPVMDGTMTVLAEAVDDLLADPTLPIPVEAARRIIAQNRKTAYKRRSDDLENVLVRRGLRPRT